jgi:hypothetical protein
VTVNAFCPKRQLLVIIAFMSVDGIRCDILMFREKNGLLHALLPLCEGNW